jgi:hypothetical protein
MSANPLPRVGMGSEFTADGSVRDVELGRAVYGEADLDLDHEPTELLCLGRMAGEGKSSRGSYRLKPISRGVRVSSTSRFPNEMTPFSFPALMIPQSEGGQAQCLALPLQPFSQSSTWTQATASY